jgi:hypothetical protein
MRFIACLALACLGACFPFGESDDECFPDSLHTRSVDSAAYEYITGDLSGPPTLTAVGGTQRFAARDIPCNDPVPHDLTIAYSEAPAIATAQVVDGMLDVTGVEPGQAMIDVNTGSEKNTDRYSIAAIDHVTLGPREVGDAAAFYVGATSAAVQLVDRDGELLVDRNLTISGAAGRADVWNQLSALPTTAGDFTVTIHAGGADWQATGTIVDHITDIVARDATVTAQTLHVAEACFFAHAGSVVVAGVPWTIQIDGKAPKEVDSRTNCAWMTSTTTGNHKVTAQALGFTAQTTLTFTQ